MRNIRMDDLMPGLREQFPDLPEKTLRAIVRQGSRSLCGALARGQEVHLQARRLGISILFYNHSSDPTKKRC